LEALFRERFDARCSVAWPYPSYVQAKATQSCIQGTEAAQDWVTQCVGTLPGILMPPRVPPSWDPGIASVACPLAYSYYGVVSASGFWESNTASFFGLDVYLGTGSDVFCFGGVAGVIKNHPFFFFWLALHLRIGSALDVYTSLIFPVDCCRCRGCFPKARRRSIFWNRTPAYTLSYIHPHIPYRMPHHIPTYPPSVLADKTLWGGGFFRSFACSP
jgi:hypothetical protein